jgi:hypothetical protein
MPVWRGLYSLFPAHGWRLHAELDHAGESLRVCAIRNPTFDEEQDPDHHLYADALTNDHADADWLPSDAYGHSDTDDHEDPVHHLHTDTDPHFVRSGGATTR